MDRELSGGGAMIDHTVHVADLLRDLLGRDPETVYAQTNARLYGRDTEDCAMLSLEYADGPFVTHDSSWSRPPAFPTWGDVTMSIVGENGIVELDMFGPSLIRTTDRGSRLGIGPDADARMIEAFLESVLDGAPVVTTLEDGLAASAIALAAYRSVASNRPEPVRAEGALR
ncbi:MAG: Gfo/Idh/MocA family oxidoreductase [Comamonadaceae bacterium]|nr:MAG: Gfo/Idh/MocA family oxidoreductase [Comamonadaceae bacterium]